MHGIQLGQKKHDRAILQFRLQFEQHCLALQNLNKNIPKTNDHIVNMSSSQNVVVMQLAQLKVEGRTTLYTQEIQCTQHSFKYN